MKASGAASGIRDFKIWYNCMSRADSHLSVLLVILLFMSGSISFAEANGDQDGRTEAEQDFIHKSAQYKRFPTDPDAAWKFGRACFDWAEFAVDKNARAEIAKDGILACRRAIALRDDLAAAHHYLALNLGQLARTKLLGALSLVDEMEHELKRAIVLDRSFGYGAPDRSLGLLYLEAPKWPLSIGNQEKALFHLEKAVQISPEYPENLLCALEASLKWNDSERLERQIKAFKIVLPQSKSRFSGPLWNRDWKEWDARWGKILDRAALIEP